LFFGFREQLGGLLLAHKLAAICEWREMAASGCSMTGKNYARFVLHQRRRQLGKPGGVALR
jgi:hypothetical protein